MSNTKYESGRYVHLPKPSPQAIESEFTDRIVAVLANPNSLTEMHGAIRKYESQGVDMSQHREIYDELREGLGLAGSRHSSSHREIV